MSMSTCPFCEQEYDVDHLGKLMDERVKNHICKYCKVRIEGGSVWYGDYYCKVCLPPYPNKEIV